MSPRHREALAHLLYGIQSDGGFILLTGEVGTGKTTVCRCLLEQIPEDVDTAYILNPKQTAQELLATACDEFKIDYPEDASIKVLVDLLNAFLLEAHQQGRKTVLIIDEAQNLSVDVLEQLRLLTNLETNQRKLLQIILLGQPELLTLLARQELRQLSQRVTARFHLDALNRDEVADYIQHRLDTAGAKGSLFPASTVKRIFQISGGIPRLINLVCDRALLGTYVQNKLQVDVPTVNNAAKEILGPAQSQSKRWLGIAASALAVVSVLALLIWNLAKEPAPVADQVERVVATPTSDTSEGSDTSEASDTSEGSHTADGSDTSETADAFAVEESNAEMTSANTSLLSTTTTATPLDDQQVGVAETAETDAADVNQLLDATEGDFVITPEAARQQNLALFQPSESAGAQPEQNPVTPRAQPAISSTEPQRVVAVLNPGSQIPTTRLQAVPGYPVQQDAYRKLFELWGSEVVLEDDSDPCQVASSSGLQCLTKLGSLRDVVYLNRPVVINLRKTTGSEWYLLTGVGEDYLEVTTGNRTYRFPQSDLLGAWSGYYTLLWRTPPAYSDPARRGDKGAAVDWLQTQLAVVEGSDVPSIAAGTAFDEDLEARVKRFQISVGLVPDGIVGPQTWIHLNSADAANIPRLDQ
ncbi:MAG: AAA family ATPase [Pseudomonadales bacterium]